MATRAVTTSYGPVSWGAVIGGVFVALVVHILLNMLGVGIGAASIDVGEKSAEAAQTLSWSAFAWWSISGIIAAFVGGWVAGNSAEVGGSIEGGFHGFLSWAVTTVLIVAFAALAAGGAAAAAGALLSPLSTATAQTAFATFTLASLVALLIGAAAAIWGGWLGAVREAPSRRAHA
jgi:hypothetical protein